VNLSNGMTVCSINDAEESQEVWFYGCERVLTICCGDARRRGGKVLASQVVVHPRTNREEFV
jgi:hypothetical protein